MRVRSDKVCFFVLGSIARSDNLPCPAAGTQPVDSENVPMEGNVETSHLLEQVRAGLEPSHHCCSDSHIDRGSSWHRPLLAHRKLVSQGTGPTQGNTSTAASPRTYQSCTYTSTGPLRTIRHRRIRYGTSIRSSYHSLARHRNQGSLPGRHQILLIPSCC